MNSDDTPGLLEDVEVIGAGIVHALRGFVNRIPFLSKGAFPFVFAPIFLLGAYFQALGLSDAVRADFAVLTWRQVPSVVVASSASWETFRQGQAGSNDRARGPSGANTGLEIRYRYTYNGRVYDSKAFGAGVWSGYSGDTGGSEEWAAQHPKGSVLKVYVNPSDPETSAVNPGPTLASLVCTLVALPFTLVGLGGLLSDQAQARLSFEAIALGWCALTFVVFALGHAITLAVALTMAGFLLLFAAIHRFLTRHPLSTIEENLDAPPHDVIDFTL